MKYFTGLLVFGLALLNCIVAEPTDEQKEKFHKTFGKCAEETHVQKPELERFKTADFTNVTPEFQCFCSCFAKEMGFIVDGEPQLEKMKEALSKTPKYTEDKMNRIVAECKTEYKGENDCEKGFNFMICEKKIMLS